MIRKTIPMFVRNNLARMIRYIEIELLSSLYLIITLSFSRKNSTPFYSILRGDRSGAQLHDELMAYGLCFRNRLHYGGASSGSSDPELSILRAMVGLPVNLNIDKKVNLPALLYRDDTYDARLKSIMVAFISVFGIKTPTTPDEIFSDVFLEHLRSRASIDCTSIKNSVVIHIRRGDVNLNDHPKRYTEIAYYIGQIQRIQAHSSRFTFIVHTESKNLSREEIQALESVGAEIKLDVDLTIAWQDMIQAEILVLAKSSFSYVPALLCTGTVVYTPFWHQKRNNWVDYNNFDTYLGNIPK
jgi:hypothetical protein